jgi:hypothetical protein
VISVVNMSSRRSTGRIARRYCLWCGFALSLSTMVAWAISIPWTWEYVNVDTKAPALLAPLTWTYSDGTVGLGVSESGMWAINAMISTRRISLWGGVLWIDTSPERNDGRPSGWFVQRLQLPLGFSVPLAKRMPSFRGGRYTDANGGQGSALIVDLPLWIPLLLFSVPTVILWRQERRRISGGGCRNCGYNLTGNVSGTCPECGTPVPEDTFTKAREGQKIKPMNRM